MAGKYDAKIEVTSNDPYRPSFEIPVTLNIEATRTLTATLLWPWISEEWKSGRKPNCH